MSINRGIDNTRLPKKRTLYMLFNLTCMNQKPVLKQVFFRKLKIPGENTDNKLLVSIFFKFHFDKSYTCMVLPLNYLWQVFSRRLPGRHSWSWRLFNEKLCLLWCRSPMCFIKKYSRISSSRTVGLIQKQNTVVNSYFVSWDIAVSVQRIIIYLLMYMYANHDTCILL